MNETETHPLLMAVWQQASWQLGFELEAPYQVQLPSGRSVQALGLVRGFGGRVGMLLIDDFEKVKGIDNDLTRMGYGISIESDDLSPGSNLTPTDMIVVLRDWDWFGAQEERPAWLD